MSAKSAMTWWQSFVTMAHPAPGWIVPA